MGRESKENIHSKPASFYKTCFCGELRTKYGEIWLIFCEIAKRNMAYLKKKLA
jgi:hypothetical protein